MRVLPVAKPGSRPGSDVDSRRDVSVCKPTLKFVGDRRVVGGRPLIRGERQPLPCLSTDTRWAAISGGEGVEHARILVGVGEDQDVLVVLGGGADHGGPADVYHLDEFVDGCGRIARSHRFEGVEIDANEVYREVAQLAEGRHVVLALTSCENASVHSRVQRLHSSVEDLRVPRGLGNLGDFEARLPERTRGPASREEFPTHACEGSPQSLDA